MSSFANYISDTECRNRQNVYTRTVMNPSKRMSEMQKMVSINGIWMVLLSCAGLSMTFGAIQTEEDHALLARDNSSAFGWNGPTFRRNYLSSLLAVFILIFCSATFWLLYLINPVRWVCAKTFISIVVTCVTGLVLIFGFVILVKPDEIIPNKTLKDDLVKLFITCILCFSSSLFFSRMGLSIEQRRRKGEFNHIEVTQDGIYDNSPLHVRMIPHCTDSNIPGISDDPPKYDSLALDTKLPNYTEIV